MGIPGRQSPRRWASCRMRGSSAGGRDWATSWRTRMSNGTHLASRKAGPLRPMIDLTCSCPWSTLAHAPSASSSGRVPVNAPLRRPRNRWEALRNRLDHAGWAGWAAPVLAGCHRPSPAGSPLHPILAGRSRQVEKAPRHNRLCGGAAMPGPASRAVPPRPCRESRRSDYALLDLPHHTGIIGPVTDNDHRDYFGSRRPVTGVLQCIRRRPGSPPSPADG
jgi:hypothetical protein